MRHLLPGAARDTHLHWYISAKGKARSLSLSRLVRHVKRPVAKSRSLPWNVAGSCPPRPIPRLWAVAASRAQPRSSRRSWASPVARFTSSGRLMLSCPHVRTWLRIRVACTRISEVRETGSVRVVGRQKPPRDRIRYCEPTYPTF